MGSIHEPVCNEVNGASEAAPPLLYQAQTRLKVIVVGAGLGGLSLAYFLGRSGHTVEVLEATPVIKEVGAGINCTPNLTRLFARWGIEPYIKQDTMPLCRLELRRWENGEFLGAATWMPEVEKRHGSPQYAAHRADILKGITEGIHRLPNVTVKVNSRVMNIDTEGPSVTLSDGSTLKADVVVGADGVKSTCRKVLYQKLGLTDRARPTGDAAFRVMIPLQRIQDQKLIEFVKTPVATRWIGPGRHVQGFPIRDHSLYNMVLCHPDTVGSIESWDATASKQEIMDHFGAWDPERLRKLLDLVPDENILKWQLCDHENLPTWTMGKLALLGDACHPMLPYVAQGAAQAVEDAGVLCLALNNVGSKHSIPTMLKAYELSRKGRAEGIADNAATTRTVLHYEDGPEQQDRDNRFRAIARGGENPDLLGDQNHQALLWGHDPEKDFMDHLEGKVR
ncbi:uncharacterized protein PV07_05570 [Cladophialophora immunda]|uniref:FAD-binding domain-containing protein n=1 Tax=Cladophialophora immunda TaxID=569365 RepID=A0A0D2AWX2_9EURO|nr:uncharacterized protein PV07_05570 [Cladophialophora immunda]KIW29782.1 hypothetical protein PV07_05570 [Cladophialophora immunda]